MKQQISMLASKKVFKQAKICGKNSC